MCFPGAAGAGWQYLYGMSHWYLAFNREEMAKAWYILPLRFLLLMSLMIPISIKVAAWGH